MKENADLKTFTIIGQLSGQKGPIISWDDPHDDAPAMGSNLAVYPSTTMAGFHTSSGSMSQSQQDQSGITAIDNSQSQFSTFSMAQQDQNGITAIDNSPSQFSIFSMAQQDQSGIIAANNSQSQFSTFTMAQQDQSGITAIDNSQSQFSTFSMAQQDQSEITAANNSHSQFSTFTMTQQRSMNDVLYSNQQFQAGTSHTVTIPVTQRTTAMPDAATLAEIMATTLPRMRKDY